MQNVRMWPSIGSMQCITARYLQEKIKQIIVLTYLGMGSLDIQKIDKHPI